MAVVDDLVSQALNDNVVSMINGGTFKHFLAIWYSNLVYPALLSGLKNSELNLSINNCGRTRVNDMKIPSTFDDKGWYI